MKLTKGIFHLCKLAIVCLAFFFTASLSLTANAAETVVYSQGFEVDNGGYALGYGTNAEWEWGGPMGTIGPGSANSGTKCWGTDLDNTLVRPAEGSIVSPAISLPGITGNQVMRVRFWAFVEVDGMYDRAEFFISKDGTTWQSLCEFFQGMDPSGAGVPAWRKYEFSIPDSYAGGNIYLKFRGYVLYSSSTFYCGGSNNLSGFYIDDVAITYYDMVGDTKLFSMEAWENPSAYASCPWVAPWNGTEFQVDNDIYSVARQPQNEYTDYYKLMMPLVSRNAVYPIEVQETQREDSFTDFVALMQVDHAADVAVAPDDQGNLVSYRPASLIAPASATSGEGEDVLALVSTIDDKGYAAYSEDTVFVDFGSIDVSEGAILVMKVAGFILGEGESMPYIGPPAIVVETMDENNAWQERGRLRPRFAYSVEAYDLSSYLSNSEPVKVRLRSISHWTKYHAIDYVALYTGEEPAFAVSQVSPTKATFGGQDILSTLLNPDSDYFEMTTGEKFYLEFPVEPLADGDVREFIFVSKGYYIPLSGSYLVYTWDGADWVMRDGYSYPGSDYTRGFNLSLFLPDPDGEYKIRVWQDYQWSAAGIDYVKMEVGAVEALLNYAWDYRNAADILSTVQNSDDSRTYWSGCPRDRITEFHFTSPGPVNIPPTTNPVVVTDTGSLTPTISWTYNDADADPQVEYEVEVWTGPGATGTIMWDPAIFSGTDTSVTYAGLSLTGGVTYYARVKAYDGTDWGQWSETSFEIVVGPVICGDFDGDLDVDIDDYNAFRDCYGSTPGDPNWNADADFNFDNQIGLPDFAAWYQCYMAYVSSLSPV